MYGFVKFEPKPNIEGAQDFAFVLFCMLGAWTVWLGIKLLLFQRAKRVYQKSFVELSQAMEAHYLGPSEARYGVCRAKAANAQYRWEQCRRWNQELEMPAELQALILMLINWGETYRLYPQAWNRERA